MCTLTMLGALEVVRTAYCTLKNVKLTLHYITNVKNLINHKQLCIIYQVLCHP